MGQLGEWPAFYTHERKVIVNELIPSEDRTTFTEEFSAELPSQTYLTIGQFGVWEIKVSKTQDGFKAHESGDISKSQINEPSNLALIEGNEVTYELTKYERNPQARTACIDYHGCSCKACGINFGDIYGEIGEGFIHVHHLNPISQQVGEYQIDPIHDLVPLCPNCHSIVHRSTPPLTIEQLKKILTRGCI